MKLSKIIAVCCITVFSSGIWAQDAADVVPLRGPGDVTGSSGAGLEGNGLDLTDVIYLLNWLFNGGPQPVNLQCGQAFGSVIYPLVAFQPVFVHNGKQAHTWDANADGVANIVDAIYLLNYLFLSGGEAPPGITCQDVQGAV